MTEPSDLLRWLPAVFLALTVGCAQVPVGGDEQQPQSAPAQKEERAAPQLPPLDLTGDLLYEYLLAEMAINRQNYELAARAYVDLARRTRDPRIARRATDISVYARQSALAVEAATLWLHAEPASLQARQTLASILIASGALQDVRPHLEMLLASDPSRTAQVFLQMNAMLARHADKPAVAKLMQELAEQYPKLPEAHLAVAQAYWNANMLDQARAAADKALQLRPDWELAALFQLQLLQRQSPAEAIQFARSFLAQHPAAKDVQLNLARLLVAENRNQEAREQIDALLAAHPQNPDIALTLGLLGVQMNDWALAEANLKRALDLNTSGADTVRFYLGQVAEERQQWDDALRWYRAVSEGEQYIPAQGRVAAILAKRGKLDEGRALLEAIQPQSVQQQVQVVQAQATALREASRYQDAFELLGTAVEKYRGVPDLLYDYAMSAEKVGQLAVLEDSLRKVIELRPEHAHAYNALGYTLADRTDRLQEAYTLIEKALALAPDDAFIQDSMGWVLYRLGRADEGRSYLERAFKRRPDPEIAAHLGEVLWSQGRYDEARRIWQSTLSRHPGNEVLQAVIKKHVQ